MFLRYVFLFGLIFVTIACGAKDPTAPNAIVPATAEQNPNIPQVTINIAGHDRAIHVETFGNPANPAIFVLHGGPGSDFRHLKSLSPLSDNYYLVMWDQRGSGLSERITRDEISFQYWRDEFYAMKNLYSPSNPVGIIGQSWGGIYAVMIATETPADVNKLILLEPGYLSSHINEQAEEITYAIHETWLQEMLWNAEFLSASDHEQLDYKWMINFDDAVSDYFYCNKNHAPLPTWRFGVYVSYVASRELLTDFDFTTKITDYTNKVLILGAECSNLGFDFQMKFHVPLFTTVDIFEVANAGHFFMANSTAATFAIDKIRTYLLE
ncbi:MAG: alpha/beta hydrolase [Gammaproteobacteria bacterium]|nr:alpha/beta hydrolase [Gammaproteobacteria bacterium]